MSLAPAPRIEHDPLGAVVVPHGVLYGPQTKRAIDNFTLSTNTVAQMTHLIIALAQVKKAAAQANRSLGILELDIAEAIIAACDEVIAGHWHEQFAVDVLQGGAGTSTNMNANEVIANRALAILGRQVGDYSVVSPNDHVNRCPVNQRLLRHRSSPIGVYSVDGTTNRFGRAGASVRGKGEGIPSHS